MDRAISKSNSATPIIYDFCTEPHEIFGIKLISDFSIPKNGWVNLKINDKDILYIPIIFIPVEPMSYYIRSFYKLLSFFKLSKKLKVFYQFVTPIRITEYDKIITTIEFPKPISIKIKQNFLRRLLDINDDMVVNLLMR